VEPYATTAEEVPEGVALVELSRAELTAADAVVLLTDHDAFDYEAIARHARLIVDTRGRWLEPRANVVKA